MSNSSIGEWLQKMRARLYEHTPGAAQQQQRALDKFEREAAEEARALAKSPPPNWSIERRAEMQGSGMEPDQIDRAIKRDGGRGR